MRPGREGRRRGAGARSNTPSGRQAGRSCRGQRFWCGAWCAQPASQPASPPASTCCAQRSAPAMVYPRPGASLQAGRQAGSVRGVPPIRGRGPEPYPFPSYTHARRAMSARVSRADTTAQRTGANSLHTGRSHMFAGCASGDFTWGMQKRSTGGLLPCTPVLLLLLLLLALPASAVGAAPVADAGGRSTHLPPAAAARPAAALQASWAGRCRPGSSGSMWPCDE
jgi:hypothetical protein